MPEARFLHLEEGRSRHFRVGLCVSGYGVANPYMKVALCDDHPIIADGIATLLTELDVKAEIARYQTASALIAAAPAWARMDLILLDLALPDADGFATLSRIRELREDVPVVMISSSADRHIVRRALDLGAMGFIPKTSSREGLLIALKTILDGAIYLPANDLIVDYVDPSVHGSPLTLTQRQWQILHRVLQGKPIKRIATELNIAESTVKTHITPILRALGVTTRTEAIVKARTLGLRFPL